MPDQKIDLESIKKIWLDHFQNSFDPKTDYFCIYIDNPFCTMPKCKFCIYKPTIIETKETAKTKEKYYSEIIIKDIREYSDILKKQKPHCVYFGGGTSSLMTLDEMKTVFMELNKHFDFKGTPEKQFESNPLTISEEKIDILNEWGFTHLTFGLQTFNEDVLKFNNRTNAPLSKIKQIVHKIESAGLKYNIDLLTFIYRDDEDEDIEILKKDLETLKKEINPKRITIFPNYKKFPNAKNYPENKKYFEKIKKFRSLCNDFAKNNGYVNVHGVTLGQSEKELEINLLRNPMLIREDIADEPWDVYTSTSPAHGVPHNYSTLAIGGFGKRKIYSYMGKTFSYQTFRTCEHLEGEVVYDRREEKTRLKQILKQHYDLDVSKVETYTKRHGTTYVVYEFGGKKYFLKEYAKTFSDNYELAYAFIIDYLRGKNIIIEPIKNKLKSYVTKENSFIELSNFLDEKEESIEHYENSCKMLARYSTHISKTSPNFELYTLRGIYASIIKKITENLPVCNAINIDKTVEKIKHLFDDKSPKILCHGDAHIKNFVNAEESYLTDFEKTFYAPKEYDLSTLLLSVCYRTKDFFDLVLFKHLIEIYEQTIPDNLNKKYIFEYMLFVSLELLNGALYIEDPVEIKKQVLRIKLLQFCEYEIKKILFARRKKLKTWQK